MDLSQISFSLGDLLGGGLQVIADFINVIIGVLPNPDPFPAMIEEMAWVQGDVWSVSFFWLDSAISIDFFVSVMLVYTGLLISSAVFALVWALIKGLL